MVSASPANFPSELCGPLSVLQVLVGPPGMLVFAYLSPFGYQGSVMSPKKPSMVRSKVSQLLLLFVSL